MSDDLDPVETWGADPAGSTSEQRPSGQSGGDAVRAQLRDAIEAWQAIEAAL